MKTSSDYRAQALQTLSGRWEPVVVVTLVYIAIAICLVGVNYGVVQFYDLDHNAVAQLFWNLCYLSASVFFLAPLGYGFSNAILWYTRRDEEASPLTNLFRLPFASGRYGAFVGIELLLILYVLGFAFLFLIFVIIAALIGVDGNTTAFTDPWEMFSNFSPAGWVILGLAYVGYIVAAFWLALTYSLAPFIALDQPTLSAYDCMTISRKMMMGHKWQLFKLQLSFMGWVILSIFTLFIGFIWLYPYMQTAQAHFYEDLRMQNNIADTSLTEISA